MLMFGVGISAHDEWEFPFILAGNEIINQCHKSTRESWDPSFGGSWLAVNQRVPSFQLLG